MDTAAERAISHAAIVKISWRLLPLIGLVCLVAQADRANIAFASLQMNKALGFDAAVHGLGAGIFFAGFIVSRTAAQYGGKGALT